MPVDAERYRNAISLTTFVNSYYQVRDVLRFSPRSVLIVGVGTGIEPVLLRHRFGLAVTTLDIDARFQPDVVGSVHDLSAFRPDQFDVALVSHVLEHMPFAYFEPALEQLARVARNAVIYLPYGGRHLEWRFTLSQRVREWGLRLRIPPLRRVSGATPDLDGGDHYWELGFPGFSIDRISTLIARHFRILDRYHNQDWKYSYNFVLSRRA